MTAGRLPVVFFGHGSPMIALETNATTKRWAAMAEAIGKPKAILCVSAHWVTRGVAVTAMEKPKTIHDFGAFPQALFDVQYPAPGAPDLAARVKDLLSSEPVQLDQSAWGLDHGTWSVLCKAYPDADVPVVQLSLDGTKPPAWHYQMGERLQALRDEGVLIIGTGNVVHNLPRMDWNARNGQPFPWSQRFHDYIRAAIANDRPMDAVNFEALGEDAKLSVPTPEHYWPLLYVLGARMPGDSVVFGPEHIEHGSLSMLTAIIGETRRPIAKAA